MFSLKSELFKKQQEVSTNKSKLAVPDVSGAIRKQHKIKSSSTSGSSKVPPDQRNHGVEERNAKDLAATDEEVDKEKLVQSVLQAKAKLYEKMTSGKLIPDEESSSMFLVDFEQKSINARMKKSGEELDDKPRLGVNIATELSTEIQKTKSSDDDWVEYTDTLGRTRTCLKKDLNKMHRIDEKLNVGRREKMEQNQDTTTKTLLSDDMRREMQREQWERDAMEEVNGPLHYENLRAGEIRELGVGYYAFAQDQETRDEQMKMLRKMREETKKEREHAKAVERKKRTALQARLEKVRLGRIKKLKSQGKEIPTELLKPIELPPIDEDKDAKISLNMEKDDDSTITEVTERIDKNSSRREWDKGKEWSPAEPAPPPKSWQNPRDERPDEFAPPSFYYNDKKSKANKVKVETENSTTPDSTGQVGHNLANTESSLQADTHLDNDGGNLLESDSTSEDIKARTNRIFDHVANTLSGKPETVEKNINEKTPVDDVHLYAPTTDKPITMKIKPMPKKNKLLITKPAFSDA